MVLSSKPMILNRLRSIGPVLQAANLDPQKFYQPADDNVNRIARKPAQPCVADEASPAWFQSSSDQRSLAQSGGSVPWLRGAVRVAPFTLPC
jgi:hypothetical protein